MKKLKVMIASLLSAIALVFACVVGTRVNAEVYKYGEDNIATTSTSTAVDNTYVLNAKYGASTDTAAVYGVYSLSFTGLNFDAGKNVTQHSDLTAYLKDSSASSGYGWRNNSGTAATITIRIGAKQNATIVLYHYYNSEDNGISANGTAITRTTGSKVVQKDTLSYTNSTDSTFNYVISFGKKVGVTYVSTTTVSTSAKSVSFIVDGNEVDRKTISNGSVTLPSNPVKDGYTFNGWLNEDGTAFTNTGLTDSVNVYADFSRNNLEVTSINTISLDASSLDVSTVATELKMCDDFFTLYGKSSTDSGNDVSIDTNNKEIDGIKFTKRIKLAGAGNQEHRCIKFTTDETLVLTVYGMSSSADAERSLAIYGSSEEVLLTNDGNSIAKAVKVIEAGTYYLYSTSGGFNIYGIYLGEGYYNPYVSLSVDANSNNTKVRVTAAIDNVDISTGKVSGIESMKYTIEGNSTWFKEVKDVYTSVDNASSGFYRAKDYTVYAIIVFSGYNNVTADFDVTFTVTLTGGQTVAKTITVVAPSA